VLPIAQASVLRWVLMGGISTNLFLAWPVWLCPGASTVTPFVGVVGNVSGAWSVWVVFGALLGPEATGPFCSNAGGHFWCFFCSCGRHSMTVSAPCGVVVVGVVDGVVV
jgi:hypothetical protein